LKLINKPNLQLLNFKYVKLCAKCKSFKIFNPNFKVKNVFLQLRYFRVITEIKISKNINLKLQE